jgi:hypothetical protein
MALSNLELDPDILWGGKSHDKFIERPPLKVVKDGASIDPNGLTAEYFSQELNGYMQEDALAILIEEGNWNQIARLRPDFFRENDFITENGQRKLKPGIRLDNAVTEEEKAVSFLAGEIVRSGLPIDMSSIKNRSDVAQLFALCDISEGEFISTLQGEQNRIKQYPDAFFTPEKTLGEYSPARRYFACLVMGVGKTLYGKQYTRDYFKPGEPRYLPENASDEQKIRYNRQMLAHNLYADEIYLPGVPFN